MGACMCGAFVFGMSVIDPDDFRKRFLADPAGVYRRYGGSRLAPALEALTERDREILGRQFASIQEAIGGSAERVADRTGLALMLGQVMMDPEFNARVQRDPAAAVADYLHGLDKEGEIARFFESREFKALGRLEMQREAMREPGLRFDLASSRGSLKATILRTVLREIQEEVREGRIRL